MFIFAHHQTYVFTGSSNSISLSLIFCQSVRLFICTLICLFICHLFIHSSTSVYPSVSPCVCQSVRPFLYLPFLQPSIYACLSARLSIILAFSFTHIHATNDILSIVFLGVESGSISLCSRSEQARCFV